MDIIQISTLRKAIRNEELLERFLIDAKDGKPGSVVLYGLRTKAAVTRHEYSFDGLDMYVFASGMEVKSDGTLCQTYCSYTRLKSW